MKKISQLETKLKQNALVSFEKDVIVGFVVSTGEDAKFVVKSSLSSGGKTFNSLEKLIDFVVDSE